MTWIDLVLLVLLISALPGCGGPTSEERAHASRDRELEAYGHGEGDPSVTLPLASAGRRA